MLSAVRFRSNTKSGGPLFGIGPTLFKYFLPVTILAEGREAPGAPSLDTPLHNDMLASFGYTCSKCG